MPDSPLTPRLARSPPSPKMPQTLPPALPDPTQLFSGAAHVTAIALANFALGFGCGYLTAIYRRYFYTVRAPQSPKTQPSSPVRDRSAPPVIIRVSQLYIYPIKACAAVPVEQARVTNRGLEHDRVFMLVDADKRSITQKKNQRLALIRPTLDDVGNLLISVPGSKPFLHVVRKWGSKILVTHMSEVCEGIDQGDEVARFFQSFLGIQGVRLMRMREGFVRKIQSRYVKPGLFQTSFSDGWPYLLTSEASLDDLSARVGRQLEMIRFRPNIVVAAAEGTLQPFQEDAWKCLAIGLKARFEIAKSCIRCKVVTVDPETGILDKENQPTVALREYRSLGKTVVFGQNMVPIQNARERAVIKIGDLVTITESLSEVPIPGSQGKASTS